MVAHAAVVERAAVNPVEPLAASMSLETGEIRSLRVNDVTRIAIGNPDVLDVTVASSRELLLQAKAAGTTTLLLWDQKGQRAWTVEVVDRAPTELQGQLRKLLAELQFPDLKVKRERSKLFVTGQVSRQEELDRLEQILSAFPGATNLVTVAVPPAPLIGEEGPLVKLSVQILELNRTDLDKLGVKWSEGFTVTQPEATDRTLNEAIFRWGTGLTRGSAAMTLSALVQRNRARILSEPKLVTVSGKEASSFIGLEVPIITASTFGTTTATASTNVEFRKTGVLLKMTPKVLGDQRIATTLEAEISGIDKSVALSVPVGSQTVLVPGFKVRKAMTEVTIASGETVIIAGLLETEDSNNVNQVPALGSMPVFGRLFRSPELSSIQRELLIAVTPELVSEAEVTGDKTLAVEQALAVAEVTASVEDPTLRYALQVQDRIAKALRYPLREKELGLSGHVKLRLHLFRDGTLGRALIAESSGIESFDLEALKAAESQSPYPPFPSGVPQKDLWLELPVLFRS